MGLLRFEPLNFRLLCLFRLWCFGFRVSQRVLRIIDIAVSDADMVKRRAAWKKPPYPATRGTLYKYIKNVKSASLGCVTDE
jgi:hypothetical protein